MDKDILYSIIISNLKNLIDLRIEDKKNMITKGQAKGLELLSVTNEINTLKSLLKEILIFLDA